MDCECRDCHSFLHLAGQLGWRRRGTALVGTHGKTGWINLDDPNRDDFEEGEIDSFRFETKSVGVLQEAWIRTGDDRWACANVWVKQVDAETGEILADKVYYCGWLENATKKLPFH